MAPTPSFLDSEAKDIQGDILMDGLPKIAELFYFFKIKNTELFRKRLPAFTEKWVTTVAQQRDERARIKKELDSQPKPADQSHGDTSSLGKTPFIASALVNIAFSVSGVRKLQKDVRMDEVLDPAWRDGMRLHALNFGDPAKKEDHSKPIKEEDYVPDWHQKFSYKSTNDMVIDGLILVAGGDIAFLQAHLKKITATTNSENSLHDAVEEHKLLIGKQRTLQGKEKHEHFGFLDGISEPWVIGVDDSETTAEALQGVDRQKVNLKEIVCQDKTKWSHNGSYMAFRYLVQKVPEFRSFCEITARDLKIPHMDLSATDVRLPKGKTRMEPSDVLAARVIGRWPNGIAITHENPTAATTAQSEIVFKTKGASVCPYSAHIRKTAPRKDGQFDGHHIMRRGIQFGDEVRSGEDKDKCSDFLKKDLFLDYEKEDRFRGLLFVGYQSSLAEGFNTVQIAWCNNENFPEIADPISIKTGIDPLIGQVNPLPAREETGKKITIAGMADPKAGRNHPDNMPFVNELVLPAGGEYFFVPSIKALTTNLPKTTLTMPA